MAAIPPDPIAIREAMARPERNRRGQMLLGLGLIVALATVLVQNTSNHTENTKETTTSSGPIHQRYVEPFNHPTGFRLLMPLAPGRLGKRAEFEGLLIFGYTVYRSDVDAAQASIDKHWNPAARKIGHYLSGFDKLTIVDQIEDINAELKTLLSAALFPDDIAQVQTVKWREMTFR